jgi:hypothetical protein
VRQHPRFAAVGQILPSQPASISGPDPDSEHRDPRGISFHNPHFAYFNAQLNQRALHRFVEFATRIQTTKADSYALVPLVLTLSGIHLYLRATLWYQAAIA